MIRKPRDLYDAAQVREMDRRSIEEHHVDSYELMCRAGMSAFKTLQECWPEANTMTVICGSGNNGGDGYVVARLAAQQGFEVNVIAVSAVRSKVAQQAEKDFRNANGIIQLDSGEPIEPVDLLVDGLLGTGLSDLLSPSYAGLVRRINASEIPVLALDVPSGLNSDTGVICGRAVRASVTITFIGAKFGLFTADGPESAGDVFYDDLDVPLDVFANVLPLARIIEPEQDPIRLVRRNRGMHKGAAGRVLIMGGTRGMPGAVRMAAESAGRVGAGLVRVATHPSHLGEIVARRPEIMLVATDDRDAMDHALTEADVIAIGPGLGQSEWSQSLFTMALESGKDLVVDADALNLLARQQCFRDNWIITPHPGEASRLCDVSIGDIQSDRLTALRRLRELYGGVVVLKGAGTLVGDGESWLCDCGNPGMASGGMGDVLTGIIAGLIAQGLGLSEAARYGVWLHAVAADIDAAEHGEIGLLATDLLPHIRMLIND